MRLGSGALWAFAVVVVALGSGAALAVAGVPSDVPLAGGYVTNGAVYAVALDDEGRTYLGGAFSAWGRARGAP